MPRNFEGIYMTAKLIAKWAFAAAVFTWATGGDFAAAQTAGTATVHLTLGFATPPYALGTEKPFKNAIIGDNKIVEILTIEAGTEKSISSNRQVNLVPRAEGETNILFLDEKDVVIKELIVVVDSKPGAFHSGFMHVHNKALISSYTVYRCWETGCQFKGEKTVSEPAPLPRGHGESQSTIQSTIQSTTTDKTPR